MYGANGKYEGVWGRGTGKSRDLLLLPGLSGDTTFTFLCDNMGRHSEGSAHQYKGIWGPVYAGAKRKPLPSVPLTNADGPLREDWQFKLFRSASSPQSRFFEAVWEVPNDPDRGLFLALRNLPQYAWVSVDGVLIGEHHGDDALLNGFASSEYVLPLRGPETEIRLRIFGTPTFDLKESVNLYSYPLKGELRDWSFRPWRNPDASKDAANSGRPVAGPCWWQASLEKPSLPDPLFLATQGLSKGQVFLNGEPMGRYWEIGPDHAVYLPGMHAVNTLAVLDEEGKSPEQTYLFRDEHVPTISILL